MSHHPVVVGALATCIQVATLGLIAAAALGSAPSVAGQSQAFRAGVNTVPVYVTVTDARDRRRVLRAETVR
jgi:hypothetical protein